MRVVLLLSYVLSLFSIALAWTKEDHEVFDLVSALEKAEGKGVTFYSWLEVSPTASTADIGRAYRKKSVTMHPDKNQGLKNIEERFARLGVIAKILRNKEDRERYDFFYKNGVPVWRGSGYYYERFRPGLGSVLVFLALLTSGLQHIIAHYNRTKDLARVDRFVRLGKASAWGPKGVPLEGKRKVRVPVAGGDDTAARSAGGRMVDLLVDGTDVYLTGPDHEPVLLDESMAPIPRLQDTWAAALAVKVYERIATLTGLKKPEVAFESDEELVDAETSGEETIAAKGTTTSRQPANKAGGKRRKISTKK